MYGVHMSRAVGMYLRTLTELRCLNSTQVAAAAGVSGQYVYKMVRGENKEPSLEKVRKLVNAVKGHWLHVGWLLQSQAPPEKGQALAEAHYYTEHGGTLTPEQRAVLTELLQDPEIAAAVVAAIDARRGA